MTQKSKGGNRNKGFGSMDEARQRELSSQGGKASAQSKTSNRGFASMDKNRQREISSLGGKASQHATRNQRGSTGRNEQPPSNESERAVNKEPKIDVSQKSLASLEEEDKVKREVEQASYSETDEDEDEGLGDGNIGRSKESIGSDEEG